MNEIKYYRIIVNHRDIETPIIFKRKCKSEEEAKSSVVEHIKHYYPFDDKLIDELEIEIKEKNTDT